MYQNVLGRRTSSFKDRDIGVLRDRTFKESLIEGQFPSPARRSLRRWFRMTLGPNLSRPLDTSSIYFRKCTRSADGKGSDTIHPPDQDKSQIKAYRNSPRTMFVSKCFFGPTLSHPATHTRCDKKGRSAVHHSNGVGNQSLFLGTRSDFGLAASAASNRLKVWFAKLTAPEM